MDRITAEQFAIKTIDYLNPEWWNGEGKQPVRFYDNLSYKISFGNPKYDFYVTPVKDDDIEWCYRVALTDIVTGEIVQELSSYGVDSVFNLADVFEELERGCRKELCSFHVIVELQGDGLYSVGIAAGEDNCRRVREDLTIEEVEKVVGNKIHSYAETVSQS